MKIMKQLLILIGFALLGTLVSYLLGLIKINFPGSLIGMIFLFVFLIIGIIKTKDINDVSMFFINNMGIFFVPGAVAILNKFQLISEIWWKLAIIVLAGFVVSFTATYFSVKLTLFLQSKKGSKK